MTVTGDSTLTPTAPSVTDVVSLGTSRSPNGVPLSVMTCGFGGAELLLHEDSPSTTAGTSATATSHARIRRGRATDLTCHILCSISQLGLRHRRFLAISLKATSNRGAPATPPPAPAGEWISPCAAGPVIVAHAAPLAQLVEQLTLNQRVRGSKP